MAILTRDGNVFVLEGPNPLVEKQVAWDKSKLVFHNFQWDEIRHKGPQRKQEQNPEKPERPQPPIATFESAPEPTPANDPEPQEQQKRDFDLPLIKYKVLCHCLPAKVEKRSDPLYGESWTRINYGSKFVFPCVMISSQDLLIEFWTSDPRQQISEKSVIYPFSYEVHNSQTNSYDRVPYDDYRWWRVTSKEPKEGGWLFTAGPSDMQPDFSD